LGRWLYRFLRLGGIGWWGHGRGCYHYRLLVRINR
jgi:hypothetical protein